jgi:hypothetical protein
LRGNKKGQLWLSFVSFVSVPFSAVCGFGVAFGLHIGSSGGGDVVCGLPLRLEEELVEKGYPSNQAPNENT